MVIMCLVQFCMFDVCWFLVIDFPVFAKSYAFVCVWAQDVNDRKIFNNYAQIGARHIKKINKINGPQKTQNKYFDLIKEQDISDALPNKRQIYAINIIEIDGHVIENDE